MQDKNGHDLQIGDIASPDNADYQFKITAFDGTVCSCTFKDFASGIPMKFLPEHLIFVSRP